MLMFGSNIQSAADQLQKVQEERVFHGLVNPKPAIASTIEQLRTIYAIDARRYSQLKRTLPYVVCGQFNPPFRRTQNFGYTERFILDFDHLTDKGLALDDVRQRICADDRVLMCFASPSRDGLKVMFALKERCHDSGLYSVFYRAFAAAFARQVGLEQALDGATSDVTRACFISIDPKAHFNPLATPVDLQAFVDTSNPQSLFDLKHKQDAEQRRQQQAQKDEQPPRPADPTGDVMAQIRARLQGKVAPPQRQAYVPQQLNDIIDPLTQAIAQTGIEVTGVANINYGKKIQARLGLRQAEVNLFYGKRGYSVVESPRRGTDDELNHLLADVARAFVADPSNLNF